MIQILAHITEYDVPGLWLAALAGFIGGVALTASMLARRFK